MLRVLSYQYSGVAWTPFRYQQCLRAAGGAVEYVTAGPPGQLESYGLPDIDRRGDVLALVQELRPDVLHLHHDCAAQGVIGWVRRVAPAVRILLTIHGEPDRSRGLGRDVPHAYHVVAADLLDLAGLNRAPIVRWIPNHPGSPAPDSVPPLAARPRVIWCPHSHVAEFKDWNDLAQIEPVLEAHGWTVEREPAIVPNGVVLSRLHQSSAAWIHRRGYLDILTMEAMSLGAAPIARLSGEALAQWSEALGFVPKLIDGQTPDTLVSALSDAAESVRANHAGMRCNWTRAECGSRWARLLSEVAALS